MKKLKNTFFGRKFRHILLAIFDLCCFALIDILYYLICQRANGSQVYSKEAYIVNSILLLIGIFGLRNALQVNHNVWRYTNTFAYFFMVVADTAGGLSALFFSRIINYYHGIWHFVVVAALTDLVALTSRFAYQIIYHRRHTLEGRSNPKENVAILGAGQLITVAHRPRAALFRLGCARDRHIYAVHGKGHARFRKDIFLAVHEIQRKQLFTKSQRDRAVFALQVDREAAFAGSAVLGMQTAAGTLRAAGCQGAFIDYDARVIHIHIHIGRTFRRSYLGAGVGTGFHGVHDLRIRGRLY